ncbi:hypothetical protein Pmi06nite_09210 [Planotetraspora mira]|uniref:Uncharacterized protein n=1 Tax=Planotetraspora mira TaxID=58121 RepID=A0A8J3TMX7_9ACTN|nr:hypothetical protein Pmi06nite_09210 [Planotetraspora mira]
MTSADLAAASAYWTAAVRARETARPDHLFQDLWAGALAGERGRELLRRKEERDRREDVLLPLRTRWFDDAVAAELTGADRSTGRTRLWPGHTSLPAATARRYARVRTRSTVGATAQGSGAGHDADTAPKRH